VCDEGSFKRHTKNDANEQKRQKHIIIYPSIQFSYILMCVHKNPLKLLLRCCFHLSPSHSLACINIFTNNISSSSLSLGHSLSRPTAHKFHPFFPPLYAEEMLKRSFMLSNPRWGEFYKFCKIVFCFQI
jgi:hypothetical protein